MHGFTVVCSVRHCTPSLVSRPPVGEERSSAPVYYCERKRKIKTGEAWERGYCSVNRQAWNYVILGLVLVYFTPSEGQSEGSTIAQKSGDELLSFAHVQ